MINHSTITSTITSNNLHNANNEDESSSFAKIFKFFSKSHQFRSSICKLFLFKPPKPRGYKFEKTSFLNGEIKYKFYLHTEKGVYRPPIIPENLEISSFSLKIKHKCPFSNILPVIYIKNKDSDSKFVVIYSHGNASDLGDVFEFSKNLSLLYKINVLAYDYRGYGISGGCTTEKTTYEDLEYILSFSQEKLHYELSNIILWGFSLGTGPTVEIAARYQNIGGVILQSPLASLLVWMDKQAQWDYKYSMNDIYCSINKIENIKAKIFIIHGKRDLTIDVRHSNLLYEKYVNSSKENNQIWLVLAEGVGHNDIQFLIEDEGGIFFKRIQKFIELVKYPLLLKEVSIFTHHRAKLLKEETKLGFLEKEKKSLKLSFALLEINEYANPFRETIKKNGVSQSTNNESFSKNEDLQYMIETDDNYFKNNRVHCASEQKIVRKRNKNTVNFPMETNSILNENEKNEKYVQKTQSFFARLEKKTQDNKENYEGVEINKELEDLKIFVRFNYF